MTWTDAVACSPTCEVCGGMLLVGQTLAGTVLAKRRIGGLGTMLRLIQSVDMHVWTFRAFSLRY